ncbi:MAG TPA: DUF2282 domain-containing protein [Gammaproteobacteria bacterium]|jgi:uncharacterized membrane protein
MIKRNALIAAAISSAFAVGTLTLAQQASAQEMEKCYGVVKAGANDCAGPGHTCQGQAQADADSDEFILLPAGTCERIAGGEVK